MGNGSRSEGPQGAWAVLCDGLAGHELQLRRVHRSREPLGGPGANGTRDRCVTQTRGGLQVEGAPGPRPCAERRDEDPVLLERRDYLRRQLMKRVETTLHTRTGGKGGWGGGGEQLAPF